MTDINVGDVVRISANCYHKSLAGKTVKVFRKHDFGLTFINPSTGKECILRHDSLTPTDLFVVYKYNHCPEECACEVRCDGSKKEQWIVYTPTGHNPKVIHGSQAKAESEALRLARANTGQEFFACRLSYRAFQPKPTPPPMEEGRM